MRELTAFVLFASCLMACGDEVDMGGPMPSDAAAGSAGSDSLGAPSVYKFDVFNAQLNGALRPYEQQRRQPLVDALSNLDSDVLCVTEIWSDADKQLLAETAKAKGLLFSYLPAHDWSTPITDPTDQNGNVPEPPSAAPCAASIQKMNSTLDWIRDTCVAGEEDQKAGDVNAYMDCLAKKALSELSNLADADGACETCVFTQLLAPETIGFIRDQCANNPLALLAFRGASGVMVLSKHPIVDPEELVLPSSAWRHSVIRAPLRLSNGAAIDYYCGSASQPAQGCLLLPYIGSYGGEGDCASQWRAELVLQSEKINRWVKSKSSRAILAGDFNTGMGRVVGGSAVLDEQYPEAYEALSNGLIEAVPAGYSPKCTQCPKDNLLLNPPGLPLDMWPTTWTSINLIGNIAVSEVTGAQILLGNPVLDIGIEDDNGTPVLVPLSYYFGFRSIIDLKP